MSAGLVAAVLLTAIRGGWRALRLWSGDAAYDEYVARVPDGARPSRRQFYLETVTRRYERPNRCC